MGNSLMVRHWFWAPGIGSSNLPFPTRIDKRAGIGYGRTQLAVNQSLDRCGGSTPPLPIGCRRMK